MYLYDFVIVFALKEEFDQFKQALCVYTEEKGKSKRIEKEGEIDGYLTIKNKQFKIYATTLIKQGMVYAGIGATKLIEKYRPKYIVILGIAAGFNLKPGSVLIANFVFPFQQGKLKGKKMSQDGIGILLNDDLCKIFNDNKDVMIKETIKTVSVMKLATSNVSQMTAELGPVATSIQVIANGKVQTTIEGQVRQAIGLEMEGYGIFLAAYETNQEYAPKPILIKSVSDNANSIKNNKYRKLAGFTSAYFFLKFLELDEIKPAENLLEKSDAEMVPFSYIKTSSSLKEKCERIIKNASRNSFICIISITGAGDFGWRADDRGKNPCLKMVRDHNVKFLGIVVDPSGFEAKIRNKFESPGEPRKNTILSKGAESVREGLKHSWKGYERSIEFRYSPIGMQFKLCLSDKAAMIEPYHVGRENPDEKGGLCGFSQIFYSANDKEYKILFDHFKKLWLISKSFWGKVDLSEKFACDVFSV